MGFQDMRKYPDFSLLKKKIDLVLISHFHLDHCGALPYFTEIIGYDGPIVMTTPTKAIFPYMLEDFRKLIIDQGFEGEPIFSLE
jgi:integrator complex subunit 11